MSLLLAAGQSAARSEEYFTIRVVDEATGRGVPLVELSTTNNLRYYTDSAGIVAFHEPGLMNDTVFFHVSSHGYEFPADGFGYHGRALQTVPGGEATLKIKRINVAERLYRMTGAGIYRDSVLVGEDVPTENPVINARVMGSDSVVNAVYNGRIHWFWGDTGLPKYPLGLFHVPGASSRLPEDGGLDPDRGVDLQYFVTEDGTAKETARMPGPGPTWIDGLTVLSDPSGKERLFAHYVKIEPPLTTYERGLVEFDPEASEFQQLQSFDVDAPLYPRGHPFYHSEGDVDYVYFVKPFPLIRVRATPEDFLDLSRYETYTCLEEGSRPGDLRVDRDDEGELRFAWKRNTHPLSREIWDELLQSGVVRPGEVRFRLTDIETGKPIISHGGSVYWNEYRQKWVMIDLELMGTSLLGEIWYAEAETPLGPWGYARKIVTHDNYSFYNPKQHPMFDQDGGRVIYFEGTYTQMFTDNPDQTPRYDYNQILYRLDLSDERVALPSPVRRIGDGEQTRFALGVRNGGQDVYRDIAFYALDRSIAGAVPVYEVEGSSGRVLQTEAPGKGAKPVFYALADRESGPSGADKPLYEFRHQRSGRRVFDLVAPESSEYQQVGVVCYVWGIPPLQTDDKE